MLKNGLGVAAGDVRPSRDVSPILSWTTSQPSMALLAGKEPRCSPWLLGNVSWEKADGYPDLFK